MAELDIASSSRRHRGKIRTKKLSTKVDLTPMVDLGFLLITFFIVSTTWSKLKSMRMLLPAEGVTPIGNSTALTIIPTCDNKVFYYHGELNEAIRKNLYGTTNFNVCNGIGNLIRLKQQALNSNPKFKTSDIMLIIKPSNQSSFKNIVSALDEVLINEIKHYTLTDLSPEEENYLVANRLLN